MIRVALVDDHALVRKGLRQLLADQPDMSCAGEAADAHGALELVRGGGIDVLVLDLALAGASGLEVLARVRAHAPGLPVLVLSGYAEAAYAVPLLRLGAQAYLNKAGDPAEIVLALRALAAGRRYLTPATAERLAEAWAAPAGQPLHAQLSARELQVMLRLAQGQSVGQLAEGLSLSAKTVSTYRSRILDKLQLATNSDLTYYALQHGLIA